MCPSFLLRLLLTNSHFHLDWKQLKAIEYYVTMINYVHVYMYVQYYVFVFVWFCLYVVAFEGLTERDGLQQPQSFGWYDVNFLMKQRFLSSKDHIWNVRLMKSMSKSPIYINLHYGDRSDLFCAGFEGMFLTVLNWSENGRNSCAKFPGCSRPQRKRQMS